KTPVLRELQHEVPVLMDLQGLVEAHAGVEEAAIKKERREMHEWFLVQLEAIEAPADDGEGTPLLVDLEPAIGGGALARRAQRALERREVAREPLVIVVEKNDALPPACGEAGVGCRRTRKGRFG